MTLQANLAELIFELGTDYKNNKAAIGVLENLETAATNLVAAINEVRSMAENADVPDATTTIKGKSERATDSETLAMAATDLTVSPGNIGAIRGVANGLAGLDGSGKVPSTQLPSFVDDVLEVANYAALPATGESGKIYVTIDNGNEYRWGGSAYSEIVSSPGSTDEVTEGSTNLYFTNARADTRANGRITALVGDTNTDLAAAYAVAKT